VKVRGVERERAATSLHQRILGALERGARAQEESHDLAARHEELSREVRETVAMVRRQRLLRSAPARAAEAFVNGQQQR
jgi:hypothetical protein